MGSFIIEDNKPYKILVVCTGNICRSPMAAGLLSHYLPAHLKPKVEVTSAGTHALHGHQAHEFAVAAMASRGIDISSHRAREVTRGNARGADLILVMEAVHADIVKKFLAWGADKPRMIGEFHSKEPAGDIQDPFGEPLEAYEVCIRTLLPCIEGVLAHLESSVFDDQ